jgi:hypothetical protein
VRECSRGPRCHDRPLAAEELGNPGAHFLHQFVEIDGMGGGTAARLPDLGKRQRASVDGERPREVDERTHADSRVDLGTRLRRMWRRSRRRRCLGRCGRPDGSHHSCRGRQAAGADDVPPGPGAPLLRVRVHWFLVFKFYLEQ